MFQWSGSVFMPALYYNKTLSAYSLWKRIREGGTRSWISLDTHTRSLWNTHSMQTAKPGWDLAGCDMAGFIRSSLISKGKCVWVRATVFVTDAFTMTVCMCHCMHVSVRVHMHAYVLLFELYEHGFMYLCVHLLPRLYVRALKCVQCACTFVCLCVCSMPFHARWGILQIMGLTLR